GRGTLKVRGRGLPAIRPSMIGTAEGGWNAHADAEGESAGPIDFGGGRRGRSPARWRIGACAGPIHTPYLSNLFSLGKMCAVPEVIQGTEHEVPPRETEAADIFDLSVVAIESDAKRGVEGFSTPAQPVIFRANSVVSGGERNH